jgi:hypothetical protein
MSVNRKSVRTKTTKATRPPIGRVQPMFRGMQLLLGRYVTVNGLRAKLDGLKRGQEPASNKKCGRGLGLRQCFIVMVKCILYAFCRSPFLKVQLSHQLIDLDLAWTAWVCLRNERVISDKRFVIVSHIQWYSGVLLAWRCSSEWALLILSIVNKASMIQCNYWIRMLHGKRISDIRS